MPKKLKNYEIIGGFIVTENRKERTKSIYYSVYDDIPICTVSYDELNEELRCLLEGAGE